MGWATLIPIILQYGVPFAETIYNLFTKNTPPTQADWDALKAAANTNARAQMLVQLAAAGIDPNSPQGQALLALVS